MAVRLPDVLVRTNESALLAHKLDRTSKFVSNVVYGAKRVNIFSLDIDLQKQIKENWYRFESVYSEDSCLPGPLASLFHLGNAFRVTWSEGPPGPWLARSSLILHRRGSTGKAWENGVRAGRQVSCKVAPCKYLKDRSWETHIMAKRMNINKWCYVTFYFKNDLQGCE